MHHPYYSLRDGRNLDEIHVNKKKELRSASTDNTSNAEATLDRVRSAARAICAESAENTNYSRDLHSRPI
jgi:hypothetical protein